MANRSLLLSTIISTLIASSSAFSAETLYIRGGTDVPQGERLYQAFMRYDMGNGVYSDCGAAIIDKSWVLTAGHCIQEGQDIQYLVAGGTDLSSSNKVFLKPESVFMHPNYFIREDSAGNLLDLKNDIALVKLKEETSIKPLPLATAAQSSANAGIGSTVTASGWGLIGVEPNQYTSVLKQASLNVTSRSCSYDNKFLCAESPSDAIVSICGGDSGGPLTALVGGQAMGVGISSHAGKFCDVQSTFTNTSLYLSWIEETKKNKIVDSKTLNSGWSIKALEDCQAPYNHVVTGYGGRIDNHDQITTIRLQVRPILSDGGLGARSIVNCGRDPDHGLEKFIELPDGYVMTGFSADVYKNNFNGLSAYARIYDPLSFSVIGAIKRFTIGTTFEEVVFKGDTNSNTVITGLGFRTYKSNLRGYRAYTGITKQPN